jgi:hypothetical protein
MHSKKAHPAKQLFPTITLRDWSTAIRRAREFNNEISAQIRKHAKHKSAPSAHPHEPNPQTAV